MKAAQISKAGGDFELVQRDIPEPGPGQVRVKKVRFRVVLMMGS
jgi:hypothetical protein